MGSYIVAFMTRRRFAQPTKAEFEILEVLWKKGPSTVRQVHEELGGEAGYTSVLKLLQIMLEKSLVSRDDRERTHVYTAVMEETQAKRGLVEEVIERAFRGSAKELILQALSTRKSSRQELAEIREMIEAIERRKSGV